MAKGKYNVDKMKRWIGRDDKNKKRGLIKEAYQGIHIEARERSLQGRLVSRSNRSALNHSSASLHGIQGIKIDSLPPVVRNVLRSSGRPMSPEALSLMEPLFNFGLGQVRIHTGARAAQSAEAINVDACTLGNNIVFGEGQYMPASGQGRSLLVHELVHFVQQSRGG